MISSDLNSVEDYIKAEFELLENQSQTSETTDDVSFGSAIKPINFSKNRYFNILPNEDTRVQLSLVDGKEGSDYINANYIDGATSKRYYICCQAPLESTTPDFWRMIYEQRSAVIVMLTKLQEKDMQRCALYWPEDEGTTRRFGNVLVHHKKTYTFQTMIVRCFLLKHELGGSTREVMQLQYLDWPDFGVPSHTASIRQLLSLMRQFRSRAQQAQALDGPLVVHCSAGVGRSGTLVAIDILLTSLKSLGSAIHSINWVNCGSNVIGHIGNTVGDGLDRVDVFNTVWQLRMQRRGMVQTPQQYLYLYTIIKDFLREKILSHVAHHTDCSWTLQDDCKTNAMLLLLILAARRQHGSSRCSSMTSNTNQTTCSNEELTA